MWPFKRKEENVWERSARLLADAVDAVMGKTVSLYTDDDALSERASEAKILDISLESSIFLAHLLDMMLFRKRPDLRESIMLSMYRVISSAYDLEDIDRRARLHIEDIIDDRMSRYGMVARGVWRPAGYWWFGKAPNQDYLTQCLLLFGDYITYYRECGKLPLGDDIEPVILVNPLDCETLAVPFIVFQHLAPAAKQYIEKLGKIVR